MPKYLRKFNGFTTVFAGPCRSHRTSGLRHICSSVLEGGPGAQHGRLEFCFHISVVACGRSKLALTVSFRYVGPRIALVGSPYASFVRAWRHAHCNFDSTDCIDRSLRRLPLGADRSGLFSLLKVPDIADPDRSNVLLQPARL